MDTPKRPFKQRRPVKIPTPESLAAAALYYLLRFAASEASLRKTLDNKLRRAALAHPAFADDHAALARLRASIDMIVDGHKRRGAINDVAFADMKAGSLRRAGRSARMIQQKLAMKGLDAAIIDQALKAVDEGDARGADLRAAQAFAKKRRLGMYRLARVFDDKEAADQARKDLAALARAGFSLDVARQALGSKGEYDDVLDDFA